jgi:hypothetical protein
VAAVAVRVGDGMERDQPAVVHGAGAAADGAAGAGALHGAPPGRCLGQSADGSW